jgi:fatty-acid desaturase
MMYLQHMEFLAISLENLIDQLHIVTQGTSNDDILALALLKYFVKSTSLTQYYFRLDSKVCYKTYFSIDPLFVIII